MSQQEIDQKNAQFWNDLCGTGLARSLGITEINVETLKKYDAAYMGYYPYLSGYVTKENLKDKKVLEIGLGYGTLSQLLASQGCEYYGLDIAPGPVSMMNDRLRFLGKVGYDHLRVGSALDIPFPENGFDFIYSIGCLHHTGNIPKSVDEIYRVLAPGGKAIVMLYNRHSFRQLVQVPLYRLKKKSITKKQNFTEFVRSLYDIDSRGEAAPHTEYVSRADVKRIFAKFSIIRIDSRNCDNYVLLHRLVIQRKFLLNNLGRILGLDLYIVAQK